MAKIDEVLTALLHSRGGSPQALAQELGVDCDKTFRRALALAVDGGALVAEGTTSDRVYRPAADVQVGVGDCPERPRGLGHVWGSWVEDERRPCKFCGTPGRGARGAGGRITEPGYFDVATAERMELFAKLRTPRSAHGQKVDR